MDDLPRQTLRELIATHGPELAADARRCEGLLRDFAGQHRREIFVLVSAAKEGVPADLLHPPPAMPRHALLAQLSRRLQEHLALTDEAARWAVESWAMALDVAGALPVPPSAAAADEPQVAATAAPGLGGWALWVLGVAALWAAIGGSAGSLAALALGLAERRVDWAAAGALAGAATGALAGGFARLAGGAAGEMVRWAVSGTVGGAAIGAALAALMGACVAALLDEPGSVTTRAVQWMPVGATAAGMVTTVLGALAWRHAPSPPAVEPEPHPPAAEPASP